MLGKLASVELTVTARGGCCGACGGLDHFEAKVESSGIGEVARSLAVQMVEASKRFEVVRRGQLTGGGSSFRKLLSNLAQIWWESALTMN